MTRLREAHLHHRQQAVAAREQLRLVAELREQAKRVGDGLGRVILEFARESSVAPPLLSSANTRPTHRNKDKCIFAREALAAGKSASATGAHRALGSADLLRVDAVHTQLCRYRSVGAVACPRWAAAPRQ